jgi:putative tricarboxylic transport membrane protein
MRALGADFCSGLALGALGAYIVFEASRWEYLGADGPGPGFFPLWYGIAMVALSLLLVIFSFKESQTVDWSGAGRALATWAALVVAVAALKLAGFLICFAALTFFVAAVMYRRPPALAATVAVAAAAAFYAVFPLALGVKLP